jgi:hypothetical protein
MMAKVRRTLGTANKWRRLWVTMPTVMGSAARVQLSP